MTVNPAVLRDLIMLYVPLVTALATVSLLLLARYPIDREAHERTLQLLDQTSRRALS